MSLRKFKGLIVLALLLGACSSSQISKAPTNSSQFFREGYPEIALQSFGFITKEGKSSINVYLQLKLASIITVLDEESAKKSGKILLEVQLEGPQVGENGRFTKAFQIDLTEEIEKKPNGVFEFNQLFYVDSGPCKVIVQVTDEQSRKVSTVNAVTVIPSLNTKEPVISSIVFLVKEENSTEYKPNLTSILSLKYDSVRVYAQFLPGNKQVQSIKFLVEKIETDTLRARRLFEPDILPGQMQFTGVDYRTRKEIFSRALAIDSTKQKLFEFNEMLKLPRNGMYRATIAVAFADTLPLEQSTDFTVRSAFFPEVKTAKELAEPLVYLMDDDEYKKMMQISNADSLKKAVDSFWLKFIGNPRVARQSIQLYYERVEYTNRYFSTFKEGWKTDPGMIYILFGPPRYTDQVFRDVYWAYGMYQNQTLYDPEQTFLFVQVQNHLMNSIYSHYLLRRSPNYFQVNYRIVDEWKSGFNLTR